MTDWDAYNRNTKRGVVLIIFGPLGFACVAAGLGGVQNGESSGWVGVGIGALLIFWALYNLLTMEEE